MLAKMLGEVVLAHVKTDAGRADVASICGGAVPEADLLKEHCERVCGEVEQELFDALAGADHDRPASAYAEQFKMLAMNLRRNVPLSVNLVFGFLKPSALPRMTSDDLMSDKARAAAEQARKESQESVQLDWGVRNKAKLLASAGVTTGEGALVCGKCKGKNTEYTQKQTRSADEPMTT
jgi:transcription elongation factor S-II